MVLLEHDKIIERWKGYYGKLLNEENPRTVFGDGVPHEGLPPEINSGEVEVALKGMKNGKAMGPNGTPVEVWKSLREELRSRNDIGSVTEDFRAGESARGMEGQCDCTNLGREVLWEL